MLKKLLNALNNNFVIRHLEQYQDIQKLLIALKNEMAPKYLVDQIMDIAKMRYYGKESFQDLLNYYKKSKLTKLRKELTSLFSFIKEVLGGNNYYFKNKEISPSNLAKKLLKPFEKNVLYEFSINGFKVNIKLEMHDNNICMRFSLFKNKDLMDVTDLIISDSFDGLFSESFNKMFCVFELMADVLGSNDLVEPPIRDTTFLYYVLEDKSAFENKKLPKTINNCDEIYNLICTGNINGLKEALRKEYKTQRTKILPQAMAILYKEGEKLISECRRNSYLIDPRIDLFIKIYQPIIKGCYKITTIPEVKGIKSNSRNIFLLAVKNKQETVEAEVVNILSYAGWGNSVLLITPDIPSMLELFETKQIDYLLQSEVEGISQKDMLSEGLKGIKYARLFEEKALYLVPCNVLSDEIRKDYALHFKENVIKNKKLFN